MSQNCCDINMAADSKCSEIEFTDVFKFRVFVLTEASPCRPRSIIVLACLDWTYCV
jgi:hypothetical protein